MPSFPFPNYTHQCRYIKRTRKALLVWEVTVRTIVYICIRTSDRRRPFLQKKMFKENKSYGLSKRQTCIHFWKTWYNLPASCMQVTVAQWKMQNLTGDKCIPKKVSFSLLCPTFLNHAVVWNIHCTPPRLSCDVLLLQDHDDIFIWELCDTWSEIGQQGGSSQRDLEHDAHAICLPDNRPLLPADPTRWERLLCV